MTNLADVVQQLVKERDQAAKTVERLGAALAALNSGKRRELGAGCQRQHERGSQPPKEHGGQWCAGTVCRKGVLLSAWPKRRRCQLPLERRLQRPKS